MNNSPIISIFYMLAKLVTNFTMPLLCWQKMASRSSNFLTEV